MTSATAWRIGRRTPSHYNCGLQIPDCRTGARGARRSRSRERAALWRSRDAALRDLTTLARSLALRDRMAAWLEHVRRSARALADDRARSWPAAVADLTGQPAGRRGRPRPEIADAGGRRSMPVCARPRLVELDARWSPAAIDELERVVGGALPARRRTGPRSRRRARACDSPITCAPRRRC